VTSSPPLRSRAEKSPASVTRWIVQGCRIGGERVRCPPAESAEPDDPQADLEAPLGAHRREIGDPPHRPPRNNI
jgi:hypothetical protein